MSQRYDAIVLGAGMSGLAAGIRLALFGKRVLLLERHSLWGGLNSFYKRAGRRFDTGLHALTNYAPAGASKAPLLRVLRQLRLRHEDLALGEQRGSAVAVDDSVLRFSNELELLESEVRAQFPGSIDSFRGLVERVRAQRPTEEPRPYRSARVELSLSLREPRLEQLLLLPALYYGSPSADDMDWGDFCVVFSAVLLEGLARPEGGIKPLLDRLRALYLDQGGELRLRSGVRSIRVEAGCVRGVELEDGSELTCDQVLSSAGWVESMRLCGADWAALAPEARDAGRLSFLESIAVLDRPARDLGIEFTTLFYNAAPELRYREPASEALTRPECGVISVPDNYASREPIEGMVRQTVLAHPERWCSLPEEEYQRAKREHAEQAERCVARYVPSWSPAAVERDVFTPRTIVKYTGHVHGAVYGSPHKRRDGRTPVENLFLIGTDQGYLGVVGALMSGIAMANRHGLASLRVAP